MTSKRDNIVKDQGYSWVIGAASCCSCVFGLGIPSYGSVAVFAYTWEHERGLDSATIGWILSIFNLIMFCPGPLYSLMISMMGCWRAQVLATTLFVIGYIGTAFSTESWHYILSYSMCIGIGTALVQLISYMIIEEYFSVHKDRIFALTMAAESGGIMLGPILCERLITLLSYRQALVIQGGIIGFINLGVALIYIGGFYSYNSSHQADETTPFLEQTDEDNLDENENKDMHTIIAHKDQKGLIRKKVMQLRTVLDQHIVVLKDPLFLLVCVHYVFVSAGTIVILSYAVELAVENGLSEFQGAIANTIGGLLCCITGVVIAIVSNRITQPLTLHILSVIVAGGSIVLAPFAVTDASYYTDLAVYGIVDSVYLCMQIPVIVQIFGDSLVDLRYAYTVAMYGIGYFIGPLVVGYTVAAFGHFAMSFYIAAVVMLVAVVIIIPLYIYKLRNGTIRINYLQI